MPRSYITLAEHPGPMIRLACTQVRAPRAAPQGDAARALRPRRQHGRLATDTRGRVPEDRREPDHGLVRRLLSRPNRQMKKPRRAGASACSIEAPTHGGRPKRRLCTRRRLLRCRIGLLGLLVIAGQVKRCFRLVIARRLKPRFRQAEPLALLVLAWGHICHLLAAFRVGSIPLRSAHRIKLNC